MPHRFARALSGSCRRREPHRLANSVDRVGQFWCIRKMPFDCCGNLRSLSVTASAGAALPSGQLLRHTSHHPRDSQAAHCATTKLSGEHSACARSPHSSAVISNGPGSVTAGYALIKFLSASRSRRFGLSRKSPSFACEASCAIFFSIRSIGRELSRSFCLWGCAVEEGTCLTGIAIKSANVLCVANKTNQGKNRNIPLQPNKICVVSFQN